MLPAQSTPLQAAPGAGSYFPLDVGNRWVYRIDNRQATASYQTWRVDRIEEKNGLMYAQVAIEGPESIYAESSFRADSSGRVYTLIGDTERLFLDPSGGPAPDAELQVAKGGPVTTPLGRFADTLNYQNHMGLILETGVLARVAVVTGLDTIRRSSSPAT